MKYQNIFFLTLIFLVVSCGKNEPSELLTEIPTIELVKVIPESNQVQQYNDELTFTISYSDGDGDLGTEDADIPSIEVIDTRDPDVLKFEYHLSPRAPAKIRIKDRAGNWSNEVETEMITVLK